MQTDGLLDNLWVPDVQRVLGRYDFTPCGLTGVMGDGTIAGGTSTAQVADFANTTMKNSCSTLLEEIASQLTAKSHAVGNSLHARSPFAINAKKAGYNWDGGKLDDVVVVLALVVD